MRLRRSSLLMFLLHAGAVFLGGGRLAAETTTFGVIGDYGAAIFSPIYVSNQLAVARLVKSWKPDFIITVGDNNYGPNTFDSFDTNVGQFYHEYIFPYKGVFGMGSSSNRFFPTLGNHDWFYHYQFNAPNTVAPYLAFFSPPGNGRYYRHRHGPVELFAIDSDLAEPDGNTATSKQAQWLRKQLAASTAPWRLVYFHEAPFSSGFAHGTWRMETAQMNWPFKEWGASAVLSGHDHIYERVFTNGLNYFVCGTGGSRLDPVQEPLVAGSQFHHTNEYGALRIDATETNLTIRFLNIAGKIIDTHTMTSEPKTPVKK